MRRLSYANVMATIAVFLALGGAATAASVLVRSPKQLKTGVVGSRAIKNGAVTSRDVRNRTLTGTDVKDGSLGSVDFGRGQLPAGPRGPQGVQGVPGPVGPTFGGAVGPGDVETNIGGGVLQGADVLSTTISTPRAGRLLVAGKFTVLDPPCNVRSKFYIEVDGRPVPNSVQYIDGNPAFTLPMTLIGTSLDSFAAGQHAIKIRSKCDPFVAAAPDIRGESVSIVVLGA